MSRAWRLHGLCWSLLLGLVAAAHAVEPATDATQRQQIKKDRAEVDARYKQAEADCNIRFAVSGCVADTQAQRREAMAGLRQRELVLDEAQRQADVTESARRIQEKQVKQAEAASKVAPRAASAPASAPASAAAGRTAAERARQRSKTAEDAAVAASRVAAQQRRASEAAAHRQDVEQRDAERKLRGKKATPLPVPSAASVAAAGSAPGR